MTTFGMSATASPVGRVSVKARPVAAMPLAELSMVTVARVVPPRGMPAGENTLVTTGAASRVHSQIDRWRRGGGQARGDGEGRVRQRARFVGAQVHRNRAHHACRDRAAGERNSVAARCRHCAAALGLHVRWVGNRKPGRQGVGEGKARGLDGVGRVVDAKGHPGRSRPGECWLAENALATTGATAGFTVKPTAGAVALGRLEVTVKVGFVSVPASVARRFTETVHDMPAATVPPVSEIEWLPAFAVGTAPQPSVTTAGVSATASPVGRVSVKARPVAAMPLAELSMVTVARVVPP